MRRKKQFLILLSFLLFLFCIVSASAMIRADEPASSADTGSKVTEGSTADAGSTTDTGSTADTSSTVNTGSAANTGSTADAGSTVSTGTTTGTGSAADAGSAVNTGTTTGTGSTNDIGSFIDALTDQTSNEDSTDQTASDTVSDDQNSSKQSNDKFLKKGKVRGGYKKLKLYAKKGSPLYVFIGDSYGTRKTRLSTVISENLGLKSSGGDYYAFFKGSYGAARSKGWNFLSLMSNLPDDESVTDVLFYGGIYNDRRVSKEEIFTRIAQLAEEARKKYPNARIMYAIGNWHSNDYKMKYRRATAVLYQNLVLKRIGWYKTACKQNNIEFLKNVETALRSSNNDKYFGNDGHHPSKEGVYKLAKAIANSIRSLNKTTKVRSVVLKDHTISLKAGDTYQLTAEIKAKRSCVTRKVIYSSSDNSICRVDADSGLLKAVGKGKCRIYCRAFDGSGKFDTCYVHVSKN